MKSIKNILLIALPLVCTSHIMAQNALKIEKEITGGRNGVQEYNITKETKEGKKYTIEQNITGGKNGIWDLAISEVVEGKKVKLFSFENAGGESGVFESNIKNGKVDIHTTEKVNFNNAYTGTASPDSLFDMLINTVQQSSGNKESIESILSMTNKLTEAPGTGRRMLTTRVEITADSTIRRNDTTEIKVGRNRIVIIGDAKVDKIYKDENGTVIEEEDEDKEDKPRKSKFAKPYVDILAMDIGFCDLTILNGGKKLPTAFDQDRFASVVYALDFFNAHFPIINKYANVSVGLGMEWQNYRFNSNVLLTPRTDSFAYTTSGPAVTKNKLTTTAVTLPVLLNFNTFNSKGKRGAWFTVGAQLEYLAQVHTKQVTKDGDTQKQYDDFNIQPLRVAFEGRIGYKGLSVFVRSPFNNMFKYNSDVVYAAPLTFGLSIITH